MSGVEGVGGGVVNILSNFCSRVQNDKIPKSYILWEREEGGEQKYGIGKGLLMHVHHLEPQFGAPRYRAHPKDGEGTVFTGVCPHLGGGRTPVPGHFPGGLQS